MIMRKRMKIVYSKSSLKFLGKLDKKSVDRIRQAIEILYIIDIGNRGDIYK